MYVARKKPGIPRQIIRYRILLMRTNHFEIITFLVLTCVLILFSRKSLLRPRSHGFYRFFAWEFLAALLILNLKTWFKDPFSWHQVLSWILLIFSLVPLVLGVHALRRKGRPVSQREGEPQLLAFEKTSALVTSGIFGYIRHPLYCSLVLLTLGTFFKQPGWLNGLLAVATILMLFMTAKVDEAECIRFFGEDYQNYMQRTKMFIPYLF